MKIGLMFFMFALLAFCMFCGCYDGAKYRYQITDNYFVYSEDGKSYFLTCKLSCENDPSIDSILSIQWNKKAILLTTGGISRKKYFVIIARGNELKCCNEDTLIRSMNKFEFDSLVQIYQRENDETWDYSRP